MSDIYTLNHTGSEIDELLDAVPDKQNKLIAGDGIEIDEDTNVIKVQLNGDYGYIPCGTRLGYYGITPPLGFLLCDGTEYLKSDYPQLAELLAATDSAQSTTLFAGSDSDHFKVPDLRGEFIRGAGTNSHTNQGSGANVGEHQDATEIPDVKGVNNTIVGSKGSTNNYDNAWTDGTSNSVTPNGSSSGNAYSFATRPTNTSENMIIAYKDIYLSPRHEYSTDEQVVGKWIDGKPVYEKTFISTNLTNNAWTKIASLPQGCLYTDIKNYSGICYSNLLALPLPTYNHNNENIQVSISSNGFEINPYRPNTIWTSVVLTIQYTKTTS